MKNNNKILIVLIIAYFIISFMSLNIFNNKKMIYLGDSTKVFIKNKKLVVKKDNYKINNKKVKIYFNNKLIDGYLYSFSDEGNNKYGAYNKDGIIKFKDHLIASSRNTKIKVTDFNVVSIASNEKEEINNKLEIKNDQVEYKKYEYDINNDGQLEKLYYVSYLASEDKQKIVLLSKDEDGYNTIDSLSSNIFRVVSKELYIYKLIDVDEDGVYELIVGKNPGNFKPIYFDIYKYSDGVFEKVK